MVRIIFMCLCLSGFVAPHLAVAQQQETPPVSICQAIANRNMEIPRIQTASQTQDEFPLHFANTELDKKPDPYEVDIAYVGHSTFRIENASGLTIATDFSGFAGLDVIPDVVTMNHAHSTHYTIAPDQRIEHVLPGWGENNTPIKHRLQIGETFIRNVTTDINNQWVGFERDGNSIFIFEMAGLCIGHLGHLHHRLTDSHYAQIGRLDILMVPVDGGHTMNVNDMSTVVKRLRASIVLPMHWFGTYSLRRFIDVMGEQFPVDLRAETSMVASVRSLPAEPTIVILQPEVSSFGYGGD